MKKTTHKFLTTLILTFAGTQALATSLQPVATNLTLSVASSVDSAHHNSRPVVWINKTTTEVICARAANEYRTESHQLTALKSRRLWAVANETQQIDEAFVVGTAVPSYSAGFNHWRYACDHSEKVEVTKNWSASFILEHNTNHIFLELPHFISSDDVEIVMEPQPSHMPSMQ